VDLALGKIFQLAVPTQTCDKMACPENIAMLAIILGVSERQVRAALPPAVDARPETRR
jgi:hypothetical protein